MIAVDPVNFILRHDGSFEQCTVKREQRHGFEAEKAPEFSSECRDCEHEVFASDAVYAFPVKAGFVGGKHSGAQSGRHVVQADALRAFMNVEEMAYAMSCSMEVA